MGSVFFLFIELSLEQITQTAIGMNHIERNNGER